MKEKRLRKLNKGIAVPIVLLFVISLFAQLIPAVFAEEGTTRQTITVNQTVEGKPEKTAYTYVIIQTQGDAVTVSERTLSLNGEESKKFTIDFTAPGLYEFTVGRLKDESKNVAGVTLEDLYSDDNVVPVKHPFGYKVTQNEDGSLIVLPYTCYDNHVEFLKDGTGIVLLNTIKGPVEPTPTPTPTPTITPTPTATVSPTPKTTPTPTSTSSNNGKGQYTPKTGDDFRIVLWTTLAVVSGLFLILALVLRRKKEDEREKGDES